MIPTNPVEQDVLVCPSRGYDMDGCFIINSEEQATELGVPMGHGYCTRCQADLGDSQQLQSLFVKRPYPSVNCDRCGLVLAVAHWNVVSSGPDFERVMCPDLGCAEDHNQRLLGVRVAGDSTKLLTLEECCLTPGAPEGVYLESPLDRPAVLAMLTMAKRDDLGFRSFISDPHSRRLVCRAHGEGVGYLAYTEHVPESFPDPTIHQIYVRSAYRGRRHGTRLVEEFLRRYPKGNICIETPIQHEAVSRIVRHFGLVTLDGEHMRSTGRLHFRSGGF